MKKIIILLLTLHFIVNATAQDDEKIEIRNSPAQFSIWYPIGTSGKASKDQRYNFSFNLGYGRTGGVNGIEINGLAGVTERDVRGLQLSGLLGVGGNYVSGMQLSGLASIANNMSGIQFSGLVGIANDMKGIQLSGLVGVANDKKGLQVSGLVSVANNFKGIQLSGGIGAANDFNGFQFNGLIGVANDFKGIQINGGIGAANNFKGLQVNGLLGAANDFQGIKINGAMGAVNDLKGLQFSGLAGFANDVRGAQISGLYSRSNVLRGFQFAIVNKIDTVECGFPIGIVNLIKKGGYSQWEVFSSDIVNVGASYKLGLRRFYNIYSVGFNMFEDKLFAAGFGFGSNMPLGGDGKYEFQPELVSYSYFPTDFKNIRYTNATQLKIGFVRNFGKVGVYVAPSVYVSTMNEKDGVYGYKISPISAVYNNESSNNKVSIGIGYTIGITLR